MYRGLSQTLIIILMLLSPLSFTTDSIPNFTPDCEAQSLFIEKRELAAVDKCCQNITRYRDPPVSVIHPATFSDVFPHLDFFHTALSSRAPPFALSFMS
jgi:hypothetical protein